MSLLIVNSPEMLKDFIGKPGSNVVLMASATFCPPCKRVTPIFEQVAKEMSGKIVALKTNLDESPSVNDLLGVGSVPTFIYYKDGKEIYRNIGGSTREQFIEQITKCFG